jgi:hypothetical protein
MPERRRISLVLVLGAGLAIASCALFGPADPRARLAEEFTRAYPAAAPAARSARSFSLEAAPAELPLFGGKPLLSRRPS